MAIINTDIESSNTTIYSSSGNNAITTVIICNTTQFDPLNPTAGETKLFLYAVPNGITVSNTQLIVNGLPIPAGETVMFDQEKMVLSDGDALVATTDVYPATLVATVSTLAV